MIVYDQISWRELIFAIYLAYLEANLNDSFFGDLGIDFVNPSVNTVLVLDILLSLKTVKLQRSYFFLFVQQNVLLNGLYFLFLAA